MSALEIRSQHPLAAAFEGIALSAGRAILDIRARDLSTQYKPDHSPVTEADRRAEAIILAGLDAACPGIPVIAEEAVAAGKIPAIGTAPFILVDPLDGTREFIAGHDDFTVNIALIEGGSPVLGVVFAPALGVAYAGAAASGAVRIGTGADFSATTRRRIETRAAGAARIALASRSHGSPATEVFLRDCGASTISRMGSSLKFCLLAEGAADLYPRFSRTMEWDTAAGDAVLRAAGGITLDLAGKPLSYGKTGRPDIGDFVNGDFIAMGRAGAVTLPIRRA